MPWDSFGLIAAAQNDMSCPLRLFIYTMTHAGRLGLLGWGVIGYGITFIGLKHLRLSSHIYICFCRGYGDLRWQLILSLCGDMSRLDTWLRFHHSFYDAATVGLFSLYNIHLASALIAYSRLSLYEYGSCFHADGSRFRESRCRQCLNLLRAAWFIFAPIAAAFDDDLALAWHDWYTFLKTNNMRVIKD